MIALAGPAFLYDRDANVAVDKNVFAMLSADVNANDLPQGTVILNKFATSGASIVYDFSMYGNNFMIDGESFTVMPYSAVGGTSKSGEIYIDRLLYERMEKKNLLELLYLY